MLLLQGAAQAWGAVLPRQGWLLRRMLSKGALLTLQPCYVPDLVGGTALTPHLQARQQKRWSGGRLRRRRSE